MRTRKTKSISILAKVIILLIPILILGFVIYNNFLVEQNFNYFYDVGSSNDNYLSPNFRISDKFTEEVNYRNATGHIIYFTVPIAQNSDLVSVQAKIKNNFPKNSQLILGAKNNQSWSYYKVTYNNISTNNEWQTYNATFNIKEDNLFVDKNQLSLIIWFPHIYKNETSSYLIPIDWINIEVHKPAII